MSVQWIQEPVRKTNCVPCQGLGAPRTQQQTGTLGAAVEVATSGIIPAVLVLGVLGLAFYGFGKLMQRRGYDENAELEENARRLKARPSYRVMAQEPGESGPHTAGTYATRREAEQRQRDIAELVPGTETHIKTVREPYRRTVRRRRRRPVRRRPIRRRTRRRSRRRRA